MDRIKSTKEKALSINLDPEKYGSFAEIGAGQETAAMFFKAGAASQTVAKTMSAYDMKFSDAIYGAEESGRYVCEPRLVRMIDKEYGLLEERLGEIRGEKSSFFSFANTVVALNYHKTNVGHGWLGIRYQLRPETPPNDIIIHVFMHDNDTLAQQYAFGIIGTNLIYGAFNYFDAPEILLQSLLDNLGRDRVEVDMIRMSGPDFKRIDNRLLTLQLVKNGLTNAAMFGPDGSVNQVSDFIYKKNILVLRGRFRPPTNVNLDMLKCGLEQFKEEEDVDENKLTVLTELTLHDLMMGKKDIDYRDFLDRVDILCSLGQHVLISNYQEYYKLVAYLSHFNRGRKIGIILGIYVLELIFDEKYYENLSGGILESFSTLFSRNVKLYVYPAYMRDMPDELYTCANFDLSPHLMDLYEYLIVNDKIEDIADFEKDSLKIISDNVLNMIKSGDKGWKKMVPEAVAETIAEKRLFGYKPKEVEAK